MSCYLRSRFKFGLSDVECRKFNKCYLNKSLLLNTKLIFRTSHYFYSLVKYKIVIFLFLKNSGTYVSVRIFFVGL